MLGNKSARHQQNFKDNYNIAARTRNISEAVKASEAQITREMVVVTWRVLKPDIVRWWELIK